MERDGADLTQWRRGSSLTLAGLHTERTDQVIEDLVRGRLGHLKILSFAALPALVPARTA
jgi:hypothetical protein